MIPQPILWVLWFILAFPYIPQILPGTDSQPTFTFLVLGIVVMILANQKAASQKIIKKDYVYVAVIIILTLFISIIYNTVIQGNGVYVSRVLAFVQFLVAFVFGASKLLNLPIKWLQTSVLVYAMFTVVYFLTNGAIEEVLIKSRSSDSIQLMIAAGRGASTLSPEPSIMAIHIMNMVVFYTLYVGRMDFNRLTIAAVTFILMASLSGYGFFIAVIFLAILYPKYVMSAFVVLFALLGTFLMSLELSTYRILVILDGLRTYGFQYLMLDASFRSRYNSFIGYIDSFRDSFPLGDAFTLFSGGGFISIVSGLGLVGLLLFIAILVMLWRSTYPRNVKSLFLAWMFIYLLSGSFGTPLVGLILGLFAVNSIKYTRYK